MGLLDFLNRGCREEKKHINELMDEVERLESEVDELSEKWDDCSAERSLLLADVNQAARDIAYLEEQHRKYGKIIASTLTAPRFKTYTGTKEEYNPWTDYLKPRVVTSIVDRQYLCFTENEWKRQLQVTFKVYEEPMERWKAEISDCDDWASIAYSLYRFGCFKVGLDYSGCFGWARSRDHAFNVYRTKDGEWMIWEPQTSKTVCSLDDGVGHYKVIEVRI